LSAGSEAGVLAIDTLVILTEGDAGQAPQVEEGQEELLFSVACTEMFADTDTVARQQFLPAISDASYWQLFAC